jgi:hypothetical protein
LEVLRIVRSAAHRAVVAVLDVVTRVVPLVGLAVPRALAGDAQVDEDLWKISPEGPRRELVMVGRMWKLKSRALSMLYYVGSRS